MSAYLKYKNGEAVDQVLCKPVLTIGRDKNSDIVLTDLRVSRNHALIRQVGRSDYYIIDSGSANGSYVNQRRVAMPTLLKNGDLIAIGGVAFVFDQVSKEEEQSDTLSMQETIVVDGSTIKQNTILVADIRQFTSLSEELHIKTLTKMMNTWFHQVADAIVVNGGEVDKFIGDCVFARWDTAEDQQTTVTQALKAAQEINDISSQLRKTFPELKRDVKIGVGINTGSASVGIGQENTALGDAVNVAFRLESASKTMGYDVILSESTYRFIPEKFWQGKEQAISVKGKQTPVHVVGLDFPQVRKAVALLEKTLKKN
jgi:adenylate cyclase